MMKKTLGRKNKAGRTPGLTGLFAAAGLARLQQPVRTEHRLDAAHRLADTVLILDQREAHVVSP